MKKMIFVFFAIAAFSLSASAQHHNDLKWVAGTCVTGQSCGVVTSFNVYRSSVSGGPYTKIGSSTVAAAAFSDTDASLTDGSTHFYVVTAAAADGTESADSTELKAVTPFFPPAVPASPSVKAF